MGGDGVSHWEHCEAVEQDPKRQSGAWVFRGTRMPVHALFSNLRDGATVDEFLKWFPCVDEQDVYAVLDYEVETLTEAWRRRSRRHCPESSLESRQSGAP